MHPLIILVAIGAGIILGKKLAAAGADLKRTKNPLQGSAKPSKRQRDESEAENLIKDPKTGVYKVDE